MTGQRILWHQTATLELMNDRSRQTMVDVLDIVFTEMGADFLRATMPVNARTCQPMRLLHGGASVALAETLASVGANCCLDDAHAALGQEINANHLRPALEGETVTGTARLLHAGARSQVWSVEISNARGQLVCISRVTMAVINRR
ncbi:MAG: hotdog fold thioesterase [Gammaproteobacteria bacterium]|nr:hotdog fold thioesterase [Gammaproteobacteria bacterium]